MSENSSGDKLIADLLSNPAKFEKQGKAYQLLQEYFHGMPLDTLKPLLKHRDGNVRSAAVFVASELGQKAKSLIREVTLLVGDPDSRIQWDALESVMVCSTGKNSEYFLYVVKELENRDDSIRRLAMRLISNADVSQLKTGLKMSHNLASNSEMHKQGLSVLLKGNSITESDITAMLNDPAHLIKMYGAIAAKRIFEQYPKLLEFAASSLDPDISRFSAEALE